VITGFGRTGANFGIDHWNTRPDIIVTGKGVGGGYTPLAAVLLGKKIYETFAEGTAGHTQGYTYAGNPLSAAIGLAVLDYVDTNGLIERVAKMEGYLRDKLEGLKSLGIIGDVRGKGFLFGVEFVQDPGTKAPFPGKYGLTQRIVEAALEKKLMVIGGLGGMIDGVLGDHLQITPSFVISEEEIDKAVGILHDAIGQVIKDLNI
jgi:adenosylmethionine-8-amino-7-oxononanoate aminotransferase